MGLNVEIDVRDKATGAVRGLMERARGVDINRVMGEGVAMRLRSHLRGLEASRPNKMGWPRQHWWAEAAKSVQNPVLGPDRVVVTINHRGIAWQRYGGTILPTGGRKALTIPADQEAYGRRAIEFPGLKVVKVGAAKRPALMRMSDSKILYWLVRSVKKGPDATVLPTDQQLVDSALAMGESYLRAKNKGKDLV